MNECSYELAWLRTAPVVEMHEERAARLVRHISPEPTNAAGALAAFGGVVVGKMINDKLDITGDLNTARKILPVLLAAKDTNPETQRTLQNVHPTTRQ